MTYAKKLVATIKVDGKILRDIDNQVIIPFGSEYSIFIKNLDSVRCKVNISIDGSNVTSNNWLIIQPNSSVEIERSINNNNLNTGNKFKFIERTNAIENNRGIKAEDGIVRIEYQFEKRVPASTYYNHYYYPAQPYPKPWYDQIIWMSEQTDWTSGQINCGNINTSFNTNTVYGGQAQYTKSAMNVSSTLCSHDNSSQNVNTTHSKRPHVTTTTNDAGITVPGNVSNQQFTNGGWFATENETHVIVLILRGKINNKLAVQPITVQYKPTCVTCSKVNKATNKFCSECGTSLTII